MIFAAVALLLQTPDTYRDCLTTEVANLEPSGEPAETVAAAVINACRSKEAQDRPGSVGASLTADDRRRVTEAFRVAYERRVLVAVVRARACRKTQKCSAKPALD